MSRALDYVFQTSNHTMLCFATIQYTTRMFNGNAPEIRYLPCVASRLSNSRLDVMSRVIDGVFQTSNHTMLCFAMIHYTTRMFNGNAPEICYLPCVASRLSNFEIRCDVTCDRLCISDE